MFIIIMYIYVMHYIHFWEAWNILITLILILYNISMLKNRPVIYCPNFLAEKFKMNNNKWNVCKKQTSICLLRKSLIAFLVFATDVCLKKLMMWQHIAPVLMFVPVLILSVPLSFSDCVCSNVLHNIWLSMLDVFLNTLSNQMLIV